MIEERKTAKEAALITGVKITTAQQYIKKYNDNEETQYWHIQSGQDKIFLQRECLSGKEHVMFPSLSDASSLEFVF